MVVSLKKKRSGDDYEPTITYQFPKRENLLRGQQEEEERLLSAIPLFCFPDGNEWASLTEYHRETFSFVLTNVDGSRKIGYCRRLLVCAAQNFASSLPIHIQWLGYLSPAAKTQTPWQCSSGVHSP